MRAPLSLPSLLRTQQKRNPKRRNTNELAWKREIAELKSRNDDLSAQNRQLRSENRELRERVQALEKRITELENRLANCKCGANSCA